MLLYLSSIHWVHSNYHRVSAQESPIDKLGESIQYRSPEWRSRTNMRLKSMLSAAAITAVFGVTVSAAIAGPLMLGPTSAPMSLPKAMGIPIVLNTSGVQVQLLSTYRQVRTFWLSRAIVR